MKLETINLLAQAVLDRAVTFDYDIDEISCLFCQEYQPLDSNILDLDHKETCEINIAKKYCTE